MNILITGGCGFIGNSIIKNLIKNKNNNILNIDKITNVSSPESLKEYSSNYNYNFKKIDICNISKIIKVFKSFKPDIIIHAAAESHVDSSIRSPEKSILTNIIGTYNLLESSRIISNSNLIFVYISTDEVYGSLKLREPSFKEINKFFPNSPYSASKASAEHLVRAWNKTFNLNTIITNCCNNFGPWQHPEKLIPLTIKNCLINRNIPIYGSGKNKREWIFVDDHSSIVSKILKKKFVGNSYNIGSGFEIENIQLVKKICNYIQYKYPKKNKYINLIKFVKDRQGHDYRYKVNSKKIMKKIGSYNFKSFDYNLFKTIDWYLDNKKWLLRK